MSKVMQAKRRMRCIAMAVLAVSSCVFADGAKEMTYGEEWGTIAPEETGVDPKVFHHNKAHSLKYR